MSDQKPPEGPTTSAFSPLNSVGLDERIEAAMSEEFVERAVVPYMRAPNSPLEVYEASVVREIGTGRVTIRYDFGQGRVAYGKLFADDAGRHAFRVLGRLWTEGFGEGSAHRVCQPLAYLSEEHFLLTRGVPGETVGELLERSAPSLPSACRDAARWLVRLHSVRVHPGEPQPLWEALHMTHNIRRLVKASQAAPQAQEALTGMMKAIWTRGGDPREAVGPVMTHGRFHLDHVFVHPGVVSVIDFDGCVPSDPARDLAEFLTLLRSRTFKRKGDVAPADEATRSFLTEYLSALPWNGQNLALYWGAFTLEHALRVVKKAGTEEAAVEKAMEFLSRELFDILNGKHVPPELKV